jgi:hypothetical protein
MLHPFAISAAHRGHRKLLPSFGSVRGWNQQRTVLADLERQAVMVSRRPSKRFLYHAAAALAAGATVVDKLVPDTC